MSSCGEFQDIESNKWKIVSRFQSTCDDSEFLYLAQPRQKIAASYMESIRNTRKRFGKSIFFFWFIQRSSSKNSIWRRARKSRSSSWISEGKNKPDKWRRTTSWHNSNADICDKAVDYEFYNAGGITEELHGRTAKDSKCRNCNSTSSLIHHHLGVENKIQNTGLKWF